MLLVLTHPSRSADVSQLSISGKPDDVDFISQAIQTRETCDGMFLPFFLT